MLVRNGSTMVRDLEGCSFLFTAIGQVHGQHLRNVPFQRLAIPSDLLVNIEIYGEIACDG